jgi:hypothetical protein
VTIQHLLTNSAFDPEEMAIPASAFDAALEELKLADRAGPVAELIAKRIMWLAQQGERDPDRLRERGVEGL